MSKEYYVYVHYRESDNLPFYVGKGKGNRAYDFNKRNIYWNRVKNKHGIRVEIIFENLEEDEAFQLEKDVILELKYFGYPLTNLSDGGEGNSGMKFSDQQRLNIAEGLRNKRYSDRRNRSVHEVRRPKSHGIKNHMADKNLYTFVRLSDGLEVTCTRSELCSEYNVLRDNLKKLFNTKNPRKSADGWKLKETK